MNADMRVISGNEGRIEINLSVPASKARVVTEAIRGMLPMAGLKVRRINDEGEEVVNSKEVFPDADPAMALRGFRGKIEMTQKELADKLGTTQNCVSDLESGKRPISKSMAIRLGKIFDITYKVFL
jgi:DNA-binding XRE family transcriptional regulator